MDEADDRRGGGAEEERAFHEASLTARDVRRRPGHRHEGALVHTRDGPESGIDRHRVPGLGGRQAQVHQTVGAQLGGLGGEEAQEARRQRHELKESEAGHQRRGERIAKRQADERQEGHGEEDLRQPQPEDGTPHGP